MSFTWSNGYANMSLDAFRSHLTGNSWDSLVKMVPDIEITNDMLWYKINTIFIVYTVSWSIATCFSRGKVALKVCAN